MCIASEGRCYEAMESIADRLRSHDVRVEIQVYKDLLAHFVRDKQLEKAEKYYHVLMQLNVAPAEPLCSWLLQVYAKVRKNRARTVNMCTYIFAAWGWSGRKSFFRQCNLFYLCLLVSI